MILKHKKNEYSVYTKELKRKGNWHKRQKQVPITNMDHSFAAALTNRVKRHRFVPKLLKVTTNTFICSSVSTSPYKKHLPKTENIKTNKRNLVPILVPG